MRTRYMYQQRQWSAPRRHPRQRHSVLPQIQRLAAVSKSCVNLLRRNIHSIKHKVPTLH